MDLEWENVDYNLVIAVLRIRMEYLDFHIVILNEISQTQNGKFKAEIIRC